MLVGIIILAVLLVGTIVGATIWILQLYRQITLWNNSLTTIRSLEYDIATKKQQQTELICNIEELERKQQELIQQTTENNKRVAAELASNLAEKQALLTQATLDLTEILAEKEKGLRVIEESTVKMEGIVVELDKYKIQVQNILGELNDLRSQAKEARARVSSEAEGRIMEYNIVDKTLTDTLEALKVQYPNLADAFAAIEWTRIWQPKFQAMTNDIKPSNDLCGIYRIWTKDENGERSYVGQAKKIRERWSQHIKKMLGVAAADNHKFYSYVKPYNAHFEIIEIVDESKLNEREHYWIDFYNAVNNGYNTKA